MTRLQALQAADDYVSGLLAEKNERGFPKASLLPHERIAEVLRVADFLMRSEDYE